MRNTTKSNRVLPLSPSGKPVLNRKPLTVNQVVHILDNELFHLLPLPKPEDEMESDMSFIKRLYKHQLISGRTLGVLYFLDYDIY